MTTTPSAPLGVLLKRHLVSVGLAAREQGARADSSASAPRLETTTPSERNTRLSLKYVSKHFGGVRALENVSFDVPEGHVLGIIGPNGSGKSTLLSLITGAQQPSSGEIVWNGHRVDRMRIHAIARLGIGRAHQIPRPFGRMTVRQNLLVAAHSVVQHGSRRDDLICQVLQRCDLEDKSERLAGSLGLLDLKRLEVARALSLRPQLLLLDEVAAGLVGVEVEEVTKLIASVHEQGVTILLVEHVQALIRALATRVIVLEQGRQIADGTPQQIAREPRVLAVYLGAEGEKPTPATPDTLQAAAAPAGTRRPVLQLEDVSVDYGKFRALEKVDFAVFDGEVVTVLGANGAGKTTLVNAIAGVVSVSSGRVWLGDSDITPLLPHKRARRGIALCHEGRHLFTELTVRDNLELGAAYAAQSATPLRARLARIYHLFPALAERETSRAGRLSGGQQQMLAIGRALMAEPRLIIFDELSLGLAPLAIERIYDAVREIRGQGISVVLIEQNVYRSLALADRVYVLERGRVSFAGSPADLRHQHALHLAYFGGAGGEDETEQERRNLP
ncbi:MAG: ATP-binding cassette domain-containing protein [Ktedonobacterales bacterium]